MEKTVQQIPFLRLTIALALGIIAALQVHIPDWLAISIVFILTLLLIFLNKNYNYSRAVLFGAGVQLVFFFLGVFATHWHNKKPTFYNNGKFLATVMEVPQKKENSYKSVLKITGFSNPQQQQFSETTEKILVYFQPDSMVAQLSAGDRVIFTQTPQEIHNNGNPFEFDYKKYLERREIYRQVYLPSANWTKTGLKTSFSISVLAEKIRFKLLEIYRSHNLGETQLEILSALTLGYKRELDPEIKRVFSSAGAMHVLAVSGLHVGIIYGFLFFILGFLRRKKAGQLIFALTSLFCLWAYAFLTGLSPSVMRAATMFSFIIVGNSIKRNTNIYNSLAASAFLLLLVNPNNLFEAGFQLSYSAVFGIVYLQPKIGQLLKVKNRFLNYFWMLLTVSVAAQIATFPISIFYFNQFPTYFFLSNLFVIPAAVVLIPLGIMLLLFSAIPVISTILATIVNGILSLVYHLLQGIESLPYAVRQISVTPAELVFIIAVLVSIFLLLKTPRPKYLKLALLSILLLVCTSLTQKIRSKNTNKFIVYNSSNNLIIQLISGKSNYVISERKINETDYEKNHIKNTTVKLDLSPPHFLNTNESFQNKDLWMKNGVIFFKGKLILANEISNPPPGNIQPDFVLNPKHLTRDKIAFPDSAIIITNKRFLPENNILSGKIFNVANQGAYQKIW